MPVNYTFIMINHQTSLDLSSVKSEGPTWLKSTSVAISQDKNNLYTERAIEIMSWGPFDLHDFDQTRERIALFFRDCMEKSIKPTISALAFALRISRQQLYNFIRGDVTIERNYSQEVRTLIRDAYQMVDVLWEDYMLNGQVNPASGIFIGKNHFGYRDVVDYVVSPGIQQPSIDAQALASKYDELPADLSDAQAHEMQDDLQE